MLLAFRKTQSARLRHCKHLVYPRSSQFQRFCSRWHCTPHHHHHNHLASEVGQHLFQDHRWVRRRDFPDYCLSIAWCCLDGDSRPPMKLNRKLQVLGFSLEGNTHHQSIQSLRNYLLTTCKIIFAVGIGDLVRIQRNGNDIMLFHCIAAAEVMIIKVPWVK